jgi:hypothetical protein
VNGVEPINRLSGSLLPFLIVSPVSQPPSEANAIRIPRLQQQPMFYPSHSLRGAGRICTRLYSVYAAYIYVVLSQILVREAELGSKSSGIKAWDRPVPPTSFALSSLATSQRRKYHVITKFRRYNIASLVTLHSYQHIRDRPMQIRWIVLVCSLYSRHFRMQTCSLVQGTYFVCLFICLMVTFIVSIADARPESM